MRPPLRTDTKPEAADADLPHAGRRAHAPHHRDAAASGGSRSACRCIAESLKQKQFEKGSPAARGRRRSNDFEPQSGLQSRGFCFCAGQPQNIRTNFRTASTEIFGRTKINTNRSSFSNVNKHDSFHAAECPKCCVCVDSARTATAHCADGALHRSRSAKEEKKKKKKKSRDVVTFPFAQVVTRQSAHASRRINPAREVD
jgi:hypothetical protein